ncbi:ACT domain-containing protein ACR12 isoform X3 [Magnolia sinica]|uniref:ACT domain-containing protein ACR12 isoform X3 n=1 Tax=Magnolia sinica TaxID=86752 RepID=UPI002659C229|nr:ACT domain-containing protein ACR12 isoform X3 [Magnolia sinica]
MAIVAVASLPFPSLSRSRVSDEGFLSISNHHPPTEISSKISFCYGSAAFGAGFLLRRNICQSSINSSSVLGSSSSMKALKDLGLDVAKGTVTTEASVLRTKFFITRLDTGRKVEDPDMLERIRLTIINNLLKYHPESSEQLAMGEAFGIKAPQKKLDVDIATHIHVKDDGPKRSLLYIETADRPGLLMEIIKIMADINISVESAEIDTEGLVAKDKFHVSYRGAALNSSLSQVLTNCLRYYLRRPETDEDSY